MKGYCYPRQCDSKGHGDALVTVILARAYAGVPVTVG